MKETASPVDIIKGDIDGTIGVKVRGQKAPCRNFNGSDIDLNGCPRYKDTDPIIRKGFHSRFIPCRRRGKEGYGLTFEKNCPYLIKETKMNKRYLLVEVPGIYDACTKEIIGKGFDDLVRLFYRDTRSFIFDIVRKDDSRVSLKVEGRKLLDREMQIIESTGGDFQIFATNRFAQGEAVAGFFCIFGDGKTALILGSLLDKLPSLEEVKDQNKKAIEKLLVAHSPDSAMKKIGEVMADSVELAIGQNQRIRDGMSGEPSAELRSPE